MPKLKTMDLAKTIEKRKKAAFYDGLVRQELEIAENMVGTINNAKSLDDLNAVEAELRKHIVNSASGKGLQPSPADYGAWKNKDLLGKMLTMLIKKKQILRKVQG